MSTAGYIKLSRKILDDAWWEQGRARTKVEAWIDLIFLARFAEGPVHYYGETIDLKRGEFVGSLAFLAERWGWTIKAVRQFLRTAISRQRIALQGQAQDRAQSTAQTRAQHRAQLASVYLLVNYEKYQPLAVAAGTVPGTVKGIAKGTKIKKEKNDNETLVPAGGGDGGNWVADAVAIWKDYIGLIPHGEMGRTLKPAVAEYGWDAIRSALGSYCRMRPLKQPNGKYPTGGEVERNTSFCTPRDFVRTLNEWRDLSRPFQVAK